MKIYKESDDDKGREIIKPIDESKDRAIVKLPANPSANARIPDEIREIIAIDGLEIGPKKAAEIHGVAESTVDRFIAGSEAKVERIANKYDIQSLATAKLMQTLHLIDPHNVDKESERVSILNGLTRIIDTLGDGDKNKEGRSVHLHLYAPHQKKESEYDTIEVGGVVVQ